MYTITLLSMLMLLTQVTHAITYETPTHIRTIDAQYLIDRGLQAIYSKFGDMHRYSKDRCHVVFKETLLLYYFIEQLDYGQYCHIFEYDSVNETVLRKYGTKYY